MSRPPPPDENIVAAAAVDRVAPISAVEVVATPLAEKHVVSAMGFKVIVPALAVQNVVAGAAKQIVHAGAAMEGVMAIIPAQSEHRAGVAGVQNVVAAAPSQSVIEIPPGDRVVAAAAVKVIGEAVRHSRVQNVIPAPAEDVLAHRGAGQGVVGVSRTFAAVSLRPAKQLTEPVRRIRREIVRRTRPVFLCHLILQN